MGLIPGSGRSLGEGNGNPLQHSYPENSMDRGAWWATVHGVARVGHNWAQLGLWDACCRLFSGQRQQMFAFYKDEMYRDTPNSNSRPQGFVLFCFFPLMWSILHLCLFHSLWKTQLLTLTLDTDTPLLYPRLSVQQAQNNNFITTSTTTTTTAILSMDSQILMF